MNVELKCGTVPDVGNGSPVRLVKTFIGQGSPTAWLGTVKTHGPPCQLSVASSNPKPVLGGRELGSIFGPLKLSVTPMLGGFDVGQFTPAKTPDALLVQRSVYSLQFEPSPKCGQQLLVAKGVPGTQVGCQTEGTIAWFDTCICVAGAGGSVVEKLQLRMS